MLVLVEVSLGAGEWEDGPTAGKDSARARLQSPRGRAGGCRE